MKYLSDSELILNPDGSIYHLALCPDEIAETIITVGDPDRVSLVSSYFDSIELQRQKREFVTHTGRIGVKRLTVMSTGMGPGNIDIVMNELDALVNIDFKNRKIKSQHKSLDIIRLGTSGSIHPELVPGDLLFSQSAFGFDTVIPFYTNMQRADFESFLSQLKCTIPMHYWVEGSQDLLHRFGLDGKKGITLTAPGFYGPQNRNLRLESIHYLPYDNFHHFNIDSIPITNIEMETATIYAFAKLLGHRALSINCILANRLQGTFSDDPKRDVKLMIELVLSQF